MAATTLTQTSQYCYQNPTALEPTVDCYVPTYFAAIDQNWTVGLSALFNDVDCGPITVTSAVPTLPNVYVTEAPVDAVAPCPVIAPFVANEAPGWLTTSVIVGEFGRASPAEVTLKFSGQSQVYDAAAGLDGATLTFNFWMNVFLGANPPANPPLPQSNLRRPQVSGVGGGGGGSGGGGSADAFIVTPTSSPKPCRCNQQQILNAAQTYGVDPYLIAATASRESYGDGPCNTQDPEHHGINSPLYGQHADGHGYGVMGIDDRWHSAAEGDWKHDVQTNINVGAKELKFWLTREHGDAVAAAHDYNAGSPGNPSIPPDYGHRVAVTNRNNLIAGHFFRCGTHTGLGSVPFMIRQMAALANGSSASEGQACS